MHHSVYRRKSVFYFTSFVQSAKAIDTYDILTVEQLHLFHHGISNRLKEWTGAYSSSGGPKIKSREPALYRRWLSMFKNRILNSCNNVLTVYRKESYLSDLYVGFPSAQNSGYLNGSNTFISLKGMQVGNEYRSNDMKFLFNTTFFWLCDRSFERGSDYS